MFIALWFDAWVGSEVDTKRFVVRSCDYVLGTEKYILRKDAWALVVHPTERRVGMAFAFHLMILMNAPHLTHL
jgi:hypothetical protein